MAQRNLLYIGIKGTVLALDRATGQEIWRTELLRSEFLNLVHQDGDLYAATAGELFCLDAVSGQVRWHNQLKGLGRGLIAIAEAGGQQSLTAREKQRRDEEAAAAAGIVTTSG
jgi:outer membrane protein assembly factor BamB